jgi:hypothetical protein
VPNRYKIFTHPLLVAFSSAVPAAAPGPAVLTDRLPDSDCPELTLGSHLQDGLS